MFSGNVWQSLYVAKDKSNYQPVSRIFWLAMTSGVVVELVIGLASILFVSVSRPTGFIPKKGSAIYLIHAALGLLLALGGLHISTKTFFQKHRYLRLSLIGLAGLFLAGIGGILTVSKALRLAGMGIMLIGTSIAFFAYLTPALPDVVDQDYNDAGTPGIFATEDQSATGSKGAPLREAARVILIDATASVLLLSAVDPSDPKQSEFWYTPGGGVKKGEDIKEAARREVLEETGYTIGDLEEPVLERRTSFKFDGRDFNQFEKYFFVRVERFDVNPKKLTDLERRSITGSRWWRIDELLASNTPLYPRDLSRLVADWLITRR